jgi:hypothetical protein
MERKHGSAGRPQERNAQAFSRLELAAMLGAVGLLALLTLPSLAKQGGLSERVQCVNNLRRVGQALQQFETEHGGRLPWRTPYNEGGTMLHPLGLNNNVWFQWAWVSNELRTPKILACPSDEQKVRASTWGLSPDGGFLNVRYRNRAVSYLIGLDVFPEDPDGLVSGDRNLIFNVVSASCQTGIVGVPGIYPDPNSSFGIGDGLHVEAGNYLFKDGRVEQLSSEAFVARWLAIYAELPGDNGAEHYQVP